MIEKGHDERMFRMAGRGHISACKILLDMIQHNSVFGIYYFRLRQRLQDSCGLSLRRLDGGRGDDADGEDTIFSMQLVTKVSKLLVMIVSYFSLHLSISEKCVDSVVLHFCEY